MGCTCCPYPLLFVPLSLAFAATTMTWVATFDCTFFTSTDVPDDVTAEDVRYWEYGLWTARYYAWWLTSGGNAGIAQTCLGYNHHLYLSENSIDAPLRVARAFGMLTCFMSLITILVLLVASCVRFGDNHWKIAMASFFFLYGFLSFLMLIAMNSKLCRGASSCTLGRAGVLAIISALVWFVTGCCMFLLKETRDPDRYPAGLPAPASPAGAPATTTATATATPVAVDDTLIPGTQQKVQERIVNPDGTTTVKTILTTTNADGSKTVTETTTIEGVR